MPTHPASPDRRPARSGVWITLGLLALVVLGFAGLAATTGWQESLDALTRLTGGQMIALLVLSLINYLFRGLRWHLCARALGLGTGLVTDLRHFLAGFAMSATPGRLGELVRMRWIKRETGWPFDRTAPLFLMDRAGDLAAMALLLAAALWVSTTAIVGAIPLTILALGAAIVVTRPRLLRLSATWGHKLTGILPKLFARIRRAANSLGRFSDMRLITLATALGVIGWLAEGIAFYLLLKWMGADVGLGIAVAIFIFSSLAGGLTGAPGGVGGAEAAMVALLALEGVPIEVALPATLIIRLTTLWFAIVIGAGVFPFAERISRKEQDALERR
ncbi:MAG: lysylphosphatidylglycerol synthase transmembrane domain-containing protein [Pseudomonadota bacterium]